MFAAEEDYERIGDVGNVVFPCGHVVAPDGDTIRLYYGAADHCIALATAQISTLLDWLETHGREYVVRGSPMNEPAPYRDQDQGL